MSSNWLPVVLGGVFALVFSGFGLLMLLVYVSARMRLAASQNWPSVQGRIDESRVTRLTSTSQGHTTSSYAPEVKYTYSVMGTAYQGSHIGFGVSMSGLHPNVEKVVARFPAGETRPVYYNPQKPAQVVLERRMENNVKALIVPIVCLLIGIGSGVVTAGMLYYRFK
jgi:hypothetical protein